MPKMMIWAIWDSYMPKNDDMGNLG